MFQSIIRADNGQIQNPLNGIVPDFTIFGTEFNQLWEKAIAGAWAVGLIICIVFMVTGVVRMAAASGANANPAAHQEGKKSATNAFIAFAILAGLAIIVGAILFFVNSVH
ncbi:hypothetical protein [Gryllotalpicola protaetiae]|uniref:Uncharacterized protein n=1 Tax=Gryllotalpicola protaetiae TaxID=2419771 RepID=A0A387BXA5_9MICO|nr:hypothetical protein [Gryllotalpicola protaetiae]AYG05529.1 hypothetical protein D7I44_17780 [Gryllotalpicola protaetiae]